MKRIGLVVTVFTVLLFLIACNQTDEYEVPTIEEYDMTEIEDCINTFRDADENTVCDSVERETLMTDYQTHFMQYFDFSIEITEWALIYSEEDGYDMLRVDLHFKEITPEYQEDENVELFFAIYESVLEDFNSLIIDEEHYIFTWFAGPNNYDISHVFMSSSLLEVQQVRFGFRTDENELTLFEDKVTSVEGYLNNDEFTSSSLTVHGLVNEIRLNVDLVEQTYWIYVNSTVLGEEPTITIQEVDLIISQYLTGYTLYED